MNKIKNYLLIVAILFSATVLTAQDAAPTTKSTKVSLTPMVGWQFGGRAQFYEGDLKIEDNVNFGGLLAVKVGYGTSFEISYSWMGTSAYFKSYVPYLSNRTMDLDVHYIQIGGVKDFKEGPITPFGLLSLGLTGFVPEKFDTAVSSEWLFSVALGAGMKIMLSDRIGIRLQGRLLMPMNFGGFGFYAGTGGSGGTVYTTVPIVQGDLSAGLIFAF